MKTISRGAPILLVLTFVGGVIFWYSTRPAPLPEALGLADRGATTVGVSVSQAASSATPLADGMLRYENREYKFSLAYPQALRMQEFAESGGAHSVVFEAGSHGAGFQVYVTPYAGKDVTREQFLKDEPSGVYQQPTPISVDGVPAIMFYGENSIMGETREVWFVRDGLLYEVATYKELEAWLIETMQTWKFI